MTQIVTRFGVHTAGGIPFLLQGGDVYNLISPSLPCPFRPELPRRAVCPHQFRMEHQVEPTMDSEFFKAFTPYGSGVTWIHDPTDRYREDIRRLMRLSCPTQDTATAIWTKGADRMRPIYHNTNLGVVVVTGAEIQHAIDADRHINEARAAGRRLVIVARDRLPLFDIPRIEPHSVPPGEYELMGAWMIHNHMKDLQNAS